MRREPLACTARTSGAAVKNQHRLSARDGSNGFVLFNEQQHDCDFTMLSSNSTKMLHVDSSLDQTVIINDNVMIGREHLNETDYATHAKWDVTGDFSDNPNDATYTHSSGSGTLTQTSANLAADLLPDTYYVFQYTVSAVSGSDMAATITTGVAHEAVSLTVNANGTYKTSFLSKASPGDFVISATSTTGGTTFTLDDVSLKSAGGELVLGKRLRISDGSYNIRIGTSTTGNSITTGTSNLLIGRNAGQNINTGSRNTCIGSATGAALTSNVDNTFIGEGAGVRCVSGSHYNTIIGSAAGYQNLGGYNTGVGYAAISALQSTGTHNTALGYSTANSATTNTNMVLVGSSAQPSANSGVTNEITIGKDAAGQGSNTATIGDSNVTSLATGGNGVCSLGTSSKTFKEAFLTQLLVNHTVTDDMWSVARDMVIANSGHAGFTVKAGASSNGTIAFADGVGVANTNALIQYSMGSDFFRFFAKYNGTTYNGSNNGDYQFRLNEFGTQRIQNSLAADDTARDSATNANRPVYLATTSSTNDTLIIDYAFGTVGEITLTNNITAIKFYNAPRHGSAQTMTVKIKQHSSAVTLSYSSVTIYWDTSNAKAGNLLWAGGASHVLSTGNNDIDIVQFTCMPHGDTNRDIYGAVIGQAFA